MLLQVRIDVNTDLATAFGTFVLNPGFSILPGNTFAINAINLRMFRRVFSLRYGLVKAQIFNLL